MNQAEKDQLLVDLDAGLTLLSTKKPNHGTVNRAVTIFQGVKVACQTIPVTPVDEAGVPIETPPGGGENPPIEPAPPEIPPGGGGGGGTTEPPPVTTTTTTYTSSGDFSTSQGYRGWYYLEQDGTNMTYNPTNARWEGRQAFQFVDATGCHPGATSGAMRRWTAQGTGTYAITGAVSDASAGGSSGIRFQILKNGTAIYTNNMADGGSFTINETGNAAVGDTFDFLVSDPLGDIGKDGTLTSLSIALTTQNTSGTGGQTQTQLPFLLNGTAPQEGTLTLTMNKPANADTCTIPMTGVNLDTAYGLLYFNGTANSVTLWPSAPGNAGISATVNLQVPVAYVKNGQNALRFTHTSGSGYTVTAVGTPVFTTVDPPTPPATQTTLPFVLNGSILPEDGLLTVNLSKPANPTSTCTVSVTGTDLAEADGTLSVNGTTNSMTIWPVNSANNGAVRTVNLTTVPSSWFNNGTNTLRFTHTSGDGFIVSAVSVSFTSQPEQPPVTPGTWPNVPGGYSFRTQFAFDARSGGGWAQDYGGGQLLSDATAPYSAPSILRYQRYTGTFGDVSNTHYAPSPTITGFYIGFWHRPSNPFWGWLNNEANKVGIFRNNNNGFGHTYLLMRREPGTTQGGPFRPMIQLDYPLISNDQVGGYGDNPGARNILPNLANPIITLGAWHRWEMQCVCSTGPNTDDGILRLWLDGQQIMNYTNVNYPGPFWYLGFTPVWDSTDIVLPGNGTEYHDFDHVVIYTP